MIDEMDKIIIMKLIKKLDRNGCGFGWALLALLGVRGAYIGMFVAASALQLLWWPAGSFRVFGFKEGFEAI